MSRLRQLMLDHLPKRREYSETIDRQCEMVLEAFRDPAPKTLVRAGIGEAGVLQKQRPPSIARGLAEAIKHADCLGLPGRTTKEAASILRILRENYQVELGQYVHVSAYLFHLAPELIGQLVRGRRVLWIGSRADVIVHNLQQLRFRRFFELHGIEANYYINTAPGRANHQNPDPFPDTVPAEQAYVDIQRQLAGTPDFDLALVGAGVVAKLVCHHIKTALGKSAIDVGLPMSALQGLLDRKEIQPGGSLQFLAWSPCPVIRPPEQTPPRAALPAGLNQRLRKRFFRKNWEQLDRECESVVEMFRSPGAKSLVRLGIGGISVLKNPKPGWEGQRPIGMTSTMLAHAVRHADCVGLPTDNRLVQYGGVALEDEPRRAAVIELLREHHRVEIDQPKICASLFLLAPDTIGRLAAGNRVLWITFGAEKIVRNLDDPAFRDYYALHDIADNYFINTPPPDKGGDSPYPEAIGPEQLYTAIQQQLAGLAEFDLALVGAGVAGKLICHHIKTILNKSAIDIGSVMSALQGLRNRPEFKPGGKRDDLVWDPAPADQSSS